MKAIFNGQIIAESNETVRVEGNHYFPIDSVNTAFLKKSESHTTCPWKGLASYYDIEVEGKINKDAAWYYPTPSGMADKIKNHVAFWRGVSIEN
jgi:uncharacterized protein (DUF427 family)